MMMTPTMKSAGLPEYREVEQHPERINGRDEVRQPSETHHSRPDHGRGSGAHSSELSSPRAHESHAPSPGEDGRGSGAPAGRHEGATHRVGHPVPAGHERTDADHGHDDRRRDDDWRP